MMIKKQIRFLIILFYKISVRFNQYFLSALFISLLTRPLSPKRNYRVLCMTKSIFSDDLNAINDVSSQIQFLSFPRLLLSEIVRKYAIDFEDLNDGSYYKKLEGTNERDKIYYFINKLTKWIQYLLKFDAVFAGNYV